MNEWALSFLCPAVYHSQNYQAQFLKLAQLLGSREQWVRVFNHWLASSRVSPFVEEVLMCCGVAVSCWVWVFQIPAWENQKSRPRITPGEGSDGVVKAEVPSKCSGMCQGTAFLGKPRPLLLGSWCNCLRLLEEETDSWDLRPGGSELPLLPYESNWIEGVSPTFKDEKTPRILAVAPNWRRVNKDRSPESWAGNRNSGLQRNRKSGIPKKKRGSAQFWYKALSFNLEYTKTEY